MVDNVRGTVVVLESGFFSRLSEMVAVCGRSLVGNGGWLFAVVGVYWQCSCKKIVGGCVCW